MTSQPKRPAFGTLLTSHMAVAAYQRRPVEQERDQAGRPDRDQSRRACAALRQHLLRGIQGVSPRGWLRARVSHGPAHSAPAAKRPPAGASRTGCGTGRRHGARRHQSLPRRGAGSAGCAVPASASFLARRRTSARPQRRAAEALLIVLASPVWDYFAGGMKPLRILVDDQNTRSAEHMGMVKTGGNYAAAMAPTLNAQGEISGRSGAVLPRTGRCRRPAPRISS